MQDSARPTPRPSPKTIGRYELLLPIASGGMGTVYLGRVTGFAGFERVVAVKLMHEHLRAEPTFTTALLDEARIAGRIHHPNVVSVLDVSEGRSGVFIVMDYVEGESLAGIMGLLGKQPLPLPIALKVLDDMLTGLHAAHELRDPTGAPLGLVHRDVTPHNVLLGLDGVARLTDFGIAKAAGRLTTTRTGLVKGKLAYMAPEQARARPLDRTCDVWAAGIIAWELFSGHRLHEGVEDAALLLKIAREAPTPLRHIRRDLPMELERAVSDALRLDSAERHPTADAFAAALSQAARAAGVFPADTRAVRDFVRPLMEPQLAARRQKLAELHSGRADASEPSSVRPRSRSSRPSVPGGSELDPGLEPHAFEPAAPGHPSSPALGFAATEAVAPAATAWHGPSDHEQDTGRTSVLPPPSVPDPRTSFPPGLGVPWTQRPIFWLLLLGPLALILLAALAVSLRSTPTPSPAASRSPMRPARPVPTTTASPALDPVPAPGETPPEIPVVSPSALPLAPSPEPSSTTATKPTPRLPVSKPKPHPTEPQPLGNPYSR